MPTDVSAFLRQRSFEDLSHELDAARTTHWEDAAGSLETAVRCQDAAGGLGHHELRGRALALQGAVTLNRGDLQGALALATEAARHVAGNDAARCELASLKSQLSFFSGSYNEALQQAEEAIAISNASGDLGLRIFARRAGCMILGNAGVPHLHEHLVEVLELSVAAGDRWQEAMSRNDLACWHHEQGRLAEAEQELARGLAIAEALTSPNSFALGVLHSTRADIRLLAGCAEEALADARRAIECLLEHGSPNPYVFGVTVRAEVQALAALDRLDDAQVSSEGALVRLGEQVPHARSLVLATIAEALRENGRIEDAYDALRRSAALEGESLRQLAELRVSLERATIETRAARHENARLEALVTELNAAHAALEQRTSELEALKEQFREQADRDWLTGLHNRRYLNRRLDGAEAFSLAVLDLDHFKGINDDHGHDAGDQVLVRVAALLLSVVRHSDVVARTGGEEFVLLMPGTDLPAAVSCCERALSAIRSAPWSEIAGGLRVTASVGIAGASEGIELAAIADSRLYAAKRAGRDRVVWR